MVLHRPRDFFRRFGASGLIGFGESYMAGDWDCADLTGLLTVFAANVGDPCHPGSSGCASSRSASQPSDDTADQGRRAPEHRPSL